MKIDHVGLRLSAQRALLGAITQSVLAIFVGVNKEILEMDVFTERDFPAHYKELLDVALVEIHADNPAFKDTRINFFEGTSPPFKSDGCLVYLRHGFSVDGSVFGNMLED